MGTGFAQDTDTDIFEYINPLIGTTNGGHVFPGATLPFGMAKAVADVSSGEAQGGYASDDSLSESSVSPRQNFFLKKWGVTEFWLTRLPSSHWFLADAR